MPKSIEASTPFGGFLMVIGLVLFALNAVQPVFANWLWAVVISGSWIAFGSLFLYPDVRLYQYDDAPLELLFDDEGTN